MNVSDLTPFERKLYWAVWTGDRATVRNARSVATWRVLRRKIDAELDRLLSPLVRRLGGRS